MLISAQPAMQKPSGSLRGSATTVVREDLRGMLVGLLGLALSGTEVEFQLQTVLRPLNVVRVIRAA
jgi:hypothetical protein